MTKNSYSLGTKTIDNATGIIIKGMRDLVVLRYMAQQVRVAVHAMEQPAIASLPLTYSLEVRHQGIQRVIMYNPQVLLQNTTHSFVGFVSGKQKAIDPHVDNEINRIDLLLAKELVSMPGLLCYSSLEFRPDNWYNLVLVTDANVKTHIKNGTNHSYAAYQLAPRYYEWIRLHSGIMPDGLGSDTLLLQKTKYYSCQTLEHGFNICEVTY